MSRSSPARTRLLQLLTAAVATLLALGVVEVGLRFWPGLGAGGLFEAGDYGEAWRGGELGPGGHLRPGYEGRVRDGLGNRVQWVNNAAGFRREEEVSRARKPGSLRVLSLGDSFAAGYRVDQEATYSALLERHLESLGQWTTVEVLIAAIETPSIGLRYLQEEGLDWNPDMVLLGVTVGNDVAQSYATLDPRGDFRLEKEKVEEPLRQNPTPDKPSLMADLKRWTLPPGCYDSRDASPPQSRASRPDESRLRLVARIEEIWRERRRREAPQAVRSIWGRYHRPLLFDNNGLGIFLNPPPGRIATAYERLFSILRSCRRLALSAEDRFLVALFPQRFQVQDRDWRATIEAYGLSPSCFDRMRPNRVITRFCEDTGMSCVDPTPEMREVFEATGKSLYLPQGDMHWNARGHRAAFEGIRESVTTMALAATRQRELRRNSSLSRGSPIVEIP